MMGKCLADPNLNKTIGSCIINIALEAPKRILCSKWLAWRGFQIHPPIHMCNWLCSSQSMFEFTVATTSS